MKPRSPHETPIPERHAAATNAYWRRLRCVLCNTIAIVGISFAVTPAGVLMLASLGATPALADGGDGNAGQVIAGGAGGADNPTGAGTAGSVGLLRGGGGGGGAGTTGGAGGDGNSAGVAGAGGAGGAVAGASGADGGNAPGGGGSAGGGGGGGGAHGSSGAGLPGVVSTGGNGGNGGNGFGFIGGGAGGGAGGYGAVVTGTGPLGTLGVAVSGGRGGNGGIGDSGGNGGTGGVGLYFSNAAGATFTVNTAVIGGNGGAGGAATFLPGSVGAGGAGIVGSNLTIINSATITGGLSGDGTTRANAVTFSGGTNLLELRAGSAITGNVVAFSAADTLRLGGAGNSSFDVSQIGVQYQGFGIFQKTGSSTWTLTGTNTAALPWSIGAGVLSVNGTMVNSTMTVNAGGTLTGTGRVGSVTVNNGGTFAPGSGAPGTSTTVAGNLAFQSGALYVIHLNPTSTTFANVGGTASLAGTVQANFGAGTFLEHSYTILTATRGRSGTFDALATSGLPADFKTSLTYPGNTVVLNLTAQLIPPTPPTPTPPTPPAPPFSDNQRNVANAIDNFFNNGGALPPTFVPLFGLSGSNLANALTQLDGEVATGAERSAFQIMSQFLNLMLDPFVDGRLGGLGGSGAIGFAPEQQANLPPDIALAYASILTKAPPPTLAQRWTAWGAAYGGSNSANGNAAVGSSDVTARTFGFAAGMDYHVTPNTIFGFALAGGGTNWGLANALGTGRSDALQAGVYGITYAGPAYFAGALAFTNHWFTTNRSALGDQLNANFDGQSYGVRLESGYRVGVLPTLGVTPYAALQAQDFHTPAYSESDVSGGGFGLSYAAMNATDVRTEIGSRFDAPTLLYGMPLILRGRVGWAHDFVGNPALGAVFETLPGASFTVNGAPIPHDSALTSAGAELFLTPRWTLLAKFDGEFAPGSQTYAGSGTLRYTW